MNTGWICPRCEVSNAPSAQRCSCLPAKAPATIIYDMFVWNDPGTLRLTRGPEWKR